MKKFIAFFVFLFVGIAFLSCDKATTTTSRITSNIIQTTEQIITTQETTEQITTTQAVTTATTSNPVTTMAPITTVPTTTVATTTVTTYLEKELFFLGVLGAGTIDSPYLVETTEGVSYFKSVRTNYDSPTPTYELGFLNDGVFTLATSSDVLGIDLSKSTNSSLKFDALTRGVYCVRISDDDLETVYVQVTVLEYIVDFSQTLKVLAIGNSFSVDGMEYLYKIAANYGIPNIILGNLYIGGASLSTHVNSITNNLNNYVYMKNTNDTWTYHDSTATLLDGLIDEDWDVITIQQVSSDSGMPATYNSDLETLIDYVVQNKTNPFASLAWHMTWAYQQDTTHGGFLNYSSDQLTMYQAITATVQEKIVSRDDISFVIPSGTAIQNLRTSFMGDNLTRDGYHLSMDIGRFTAGLTWFKQITGLSIENISYKPSGVTEADFLAIVEAVNNAVEYQFVVTNSTHTTG
ncbi:MAG: DUF4886 domain-containing protein [Tenericutes bacterium]|nr:DUF4886 domain-containing protein [Mycoplasmatota bacterium]